ncbi:MAG: OmpA family protein [Planctomycetota bacterium]
MLRSTRSLFAAVLVSGAFFGVGCVSQEEYDNVVDGSSSQAALIAELQANNKSLTDTVGRKDSRIDELAAQVRAAEDTNGRLRQQIIDVRQSQSDLNQRIGDIRLTGLDPRIDAALRSLARTNAGMVTYNPDRGMLQLTSDLTFTPGSDTVQEGAKQALAAIANVMNDLSAADFGLKIVGHTDSQRISNPTTRRNHPTNRHLSVHRAIAVSESLQSFGVAADRVLVAGWGQFDPSVPNSARGGTAANRRVEVFVAPLNEIRSGPREFGPTTTEPEASGNTGGSRQPIDVPVK